MSKRPVGPGQIVKTLEVLFELDMSLYQDEFGRPYKLLGRIVREVEPADGNFDPKFDIRLFYLRRYRRKDVLTATDKGIRFSDIDLEYAVRDLQRQSKTFGDVLLDVFYGRDRFIAKLSKDLVIAVHSSVVRKMYNNPAVQGDYVDLRKYFIHNDTNEVTSTRRGFKLAYEDIMAIKRLEDAENRCLLQTALDSLQRHRNRLATSEIPAESQ